MSGAPKPEYIQAVALSWGVAALVFGATILALVLRYRGLRRELERLGAPVDERGRGEGDQPSGASPGESSGKLRSRS